MWLTKKWFKLDGCSADDIDGCFVVFKCEFRNDKLYLNKINEINIYFCCILVGFDIILFGWGLRVLFELLESTWFSCNAMQGHLSQNQTTKLSSFSDYSQTDSWQHIPRPSADIIIIFDYKRRK